MSGGTFNYKQSAILSVIGDINILLDTSVKDCDKKIKYEMEKLSNDLSEIYNRVHDLDWFLSGEYSYETYMEKINGRKNIKKINKLKKLK